MYALLDPETTDVQPLDCEFAVEARGVTKEYGELDNQIDVLKGIDLAVKRGEILAITGPSGSGKSTLLACLSALDAVSAGQVWINGENVTGMRENALASVRNQSIGFVFQNFNLIGTLTARENVELPMMLSSRSGFKPGPRASALLELVGLGHRQDHLPAQLSGGEQQRVALARALANDPEIIFADEPTGNLDTLNGEMILQLLIDLKRRFHKTLIVVTHDPLVAARCDRTVHLYDGRFVTPTGSGKNGAGG
ncbi:MAG TPA: ABC transporter ATP-binding protein [Chloroflexota bacterium]